MATTQDITFSVLFSVVLVFNIAGNSLVIYIITKERGMKTSTNYLLFNLAVADLLFGVFLAPQYIFLPFFRYSVPDGVLGDWLCKLLFHSNIPWMASRASVFTMICLSVERYFAVCRPHSFSQRFSPKIVKVFILVSWLYVVASTSPLFIFSVRFRGNYFFCILSNASILEIRSVIVLVEILGSLTLMVIFTMKICISLWCKQTVEPTGEREITERKKKKKVTLCVLAVVVTFIVCWIPAAVFYITYGLTSTYIEAVETAIILITTVNASLDPYLFSFQSSRFKILAEKILCCK